MSGKGDTPRPLSVTPEQFAANFDAIDWDAREREAWSGEAMLKAAEQGRGGVDRAIAAGLIEVISP